MFKYSTLLIVTILTQFTLIISKTTETKTTTLSPSSSSSPLNQLSSNITTNSTTINDNHGSAKKLIHPSDQFDQTNTTNQINGSEVTSLPSKIHYVDFKLTENFNTSNDFYVALTNGTDQPDDLNPVESTNETIIDQGKHMFNSLYNKVTNLIDYDSVDNNILYNLWIPFISGFLVGLALLVLLCCCRKCCRRCPCCRKSHKISFNQSKRGSKKLQSVDDNRYLLVSNHSDSEGV